MQIAVKTMIPDNDSQWGDLSQEYFYMHYWVDRHPNIVQVLGVLIDKKYVFHLFFENFSFPFLSVMGLVMVYVRAYSLSWKDVSTTYILP